jgi:DNA-binding NtrC family response regulator
MREFLVVCRDPQLNAVIEAGIGNDAGPEGLTFDAAMPLLESHPYEYLFIEFAAIPGTDGRSATLTGLQARFEPIWRLRPSLKIIVIISADQIPAGIAAVEAGAAGYLKLPLSREEIRFITRDVYEGEILESELDYLRERFWEADVREIVRTRCANMKKAFDLVQSVAPTRTTVLLTGETGTGKNLLAKLIHRHSNRREAQFISVHCGAIPDTLLESELFGHEKGAFTGAVRRKMGKFEIANGGTIFLDEVGTLTPAAQVKLLMVLQEGLFERVGGETTLKTDVRVIAATNANLKQMSEEGSFRKDLFYRLNVFPIELPPLRERRSDIPHLVEGFLKKLSDFGPKTIRSVHPSVIHALGRYSWPGNIRELENLVERAYILEYADTLTPESFPAEFFDEEDAPTEVAIDMNNTLAQVRASGVEEIERRYLKDLLSRHKGRINASAEEAGITTRQLHKLMKKYGYRKEAFKTAS